MPRIPAPRPIVRSTRRLSAIYLPAYCAAAIELGRARATIEAWPGARPMVKVSSGRPLARDATERIVLVAHGEPMLIPASDRQTCDPYLFRIAQSIRCGLRRNVAPPARYLDSLAGPLARHLELHYAGRTRQRERSGLSDVRLAKALAFIDQNLFADFPIEALAAAASLSPFHFQRMFKRSTGLAPQAFITRRRIDAAGKLLVSTELPVAEIARRVGYANQAHFATLFRRLARITPSKYRSLARRGTRPEALPTS